MPCLLHTPSLDGFYNHGRYIEHNRKNSSYTCVQNFTDDLSFVSAVNSRLIMLLNITQCFVSLVFTCAVANAATLCNGPMNCCPGVEFKLLKRCFVTAAVALWQGTSRHTCVEYVHFSFRVTAATTAVRPLACVSQRSCQLKFQISAFLWNTDPVPNWNSFWGPC